MLAAPLAWSAIFIVTIMMADVKPVLRLSGRAGLMPAILAGIPPMANPPVAEKSALQALTLHKYCSRAGLMPAIFIYRRTKLPDH
jgi:hypothetical protein